MIKNQGQQACPWDKRKVIFMKNYRHHLIKTLHQKYPKGTRVELIHMADEQAPPTGTKGTVKHVDDMGTIHVSWETGSSLGLIPGVDSFKVIEGGEKNVRNEKS